MFPYRKILVVGVSCTVAFVVGIAVTSGLGPRIFVLAHAAEPATDPSVKEYVTREDVRKACEQLRISDWSQRKSPEVEEAEAKVILTALNLDGAKMSIASFRRGLTVELEHGLKFHDANVTNNHPLLTGKIVAAHLKEFADYYQRLDVLEVEGDLHKSIVAGNTSELPDLHRKLAQARLALAQLEAQQLSK